MCIAKSAVIFGSRLAKRGGSQPVATGYVRLYRLSVSVITRGRVAAANGSQRVSAYSVAGSGVRRTLRSSAYVWNCGLADPRQRLLRGRSNGGLDDGPRLIL